MADAVPDAFGVTLVWLGFAPLTTGRAVDTHPALELGCGPEVRDLAAAVVPDWLGCPWPAATVPADRVPPPALCVPPPSVPAPLRVDPPPPLSEELAWRIAWRTG